MRPRYEVSHAQSLSWLASAHAAAEIAGGGLSDAACVAIATRIDHRVHRCACGPDRIVTRASVLPDVQTTNWDEHSIYDLSSHPHGQGTAARTRRFAEEVTAYFAIAYPEAAAAPDDLIHVTCTGYVAPSGAQRLVALRGWGRTTRVTHAYHMGCYAALPAIRIANGYLATAKSGHRVDIAHTELCSLHLDPTDHSAEQLVVQSLFADGLIAYSVVSDPQRSGLRLLAQTEHVLPSSSHMMGWSVADFGMAMTLHRDVPNRVADALRGFVQELFAAAELSLGRLGDCVFAVHPGGPKIVDRVRQVLELSADQVAASNAVLREHGNMSSATLPHIWMRVLDDPAVRSGTPVVSLAFGPGLTVSGAVLEKR
ncbi:MAG: 3-oxoacyl-[acyl-carrier-protein] synthase III C-terminal domain-containing protein [Kofleriaceae bacterium]